MGINPRPCGDKDPEPGGNDGGKACVALVLGGGGGGGVLVTSDKWRPLAPG